MNTAIIVPNTVEVANFHEVIEPAVIIVDEQKNYISGYSIVAFDTDELEYMITSKMFYTDSIAPGEALNIDGRLMIGVDREKRYEGYLEEKSAQLPLNAK